MRERQRASWGKREIDRERERKVERAGKRERVTGTGARLRLGEAKGK